jgi:hypothetical protein
MEYNHPTATEVDKKRAAPIFPPQWLLIGWMFVLTVLLAQADQIKGNNNKNLELGGNGMMGIPFATQPGYDYQVEYKINLTDAVWIPLGNVISGDGTIQSLNDTIGANNCFYRMQIQ